tara:strand:+ start:7564 stop:9321 length:1758 start_codon:yes stop_codon:yes gene_type:complete
MTASDPYDVAVQSARDGKPWRGILERLLLDVPHEQAGTLMLRIKESRGAWGLLLTGATGEALLIGDALSGTAIALSDLGFRVTCLDPERGACVLARNRAASLAPGRAFEVVGGRDARLPFQNASFDLVVHETGQRFGLNDFGFPSSELRRVARGERVLVADNRLAYKRSAGVRGQFERVHPVRWLGLVLRPPSGEHTLLGYRRQGGETAAAYSLYPDSREFSHVVALDAPRPRLTIGRRERQNRLKMLGHKAGLFPWLTPSYALHWGANGASRIERAVAALSERLGEPNPGIDHLVATRSNDALVLTAPDDAFPEDEVGEPGPGRWALHIPLSPAKRRLVEIHHEFLTQVRAQFPTVPVPEPLFLGELEGIHLAAERRLPGWSAPNHTGSSAEIERMLFDASRHFAGLQVRAPQPFNEDDFEEILRPRFQIVRDTCARSATEKVIARMEAKTFERIIGMTFPLMLHHADLRAKHIQTAKDGTVTGFLDWGAASAKHVPYLDVLHLACHTRTQEIDCTAGDAWRRLIAGKFDDRERSVLEDHAARVGADRELRDVIEAAYPALMAGMSELNWDYSRPRWVHDHYQI